MPADQTCGGRDQIGIISCFFTIRQHRDIFQPGTNTMPSIKRTSIDRPARHSITVMNLLQRDARSHHNLFHHSSSLNCHAGIGVKRLNQNAATPALQSGPHESSCIPHAQQSSLNRDAASKQQLTKFHDSRFTLIRRDEIRHLLPRLDDTKALSRILHNRR